MNSAALEVEMNEILFQWAWVPMADGVGISVLEAGALVAEAERHGDQARLVPGDEVARGAPARRARTYVVRSIDAPRASLSYLSTPGSGDPEAELALGLRREAHIWPSAAAAAAWVDARHRDEHWAIEPA